MQYKYFRMVDDVTIIVYFVYHYDIATSLYVKIYQVYDLALYGSDR